MERLDLPTFGFEGIQFSPEAQLGRTEVLGMATDALFDVVPPKSQWTGASLAAQCNVDVRMIGVEMRDGNPVRSKYSKVLKRWVISSCAERLRDNVTRQMWTV